MMFINITSPEELKSERAKLLIQTVDLIKQQQRSCLRYAQKLQAIKNKILKLEKQIGG